MRVLAATLLSTAAVILLGLPRPVLGSLSPRQQGPSGGLSRGLDLDLASAPLAGREADEADELDELGELELGRHHQRHGARDDNGGRGAVVRREKRQAAATSATSPATASATATLPAAPGAGDENYVEACPNPEYQGLNETVTCLNFTDPVMPKGYGGRTCTSLTGTPLRVGSPQGISSVRMFGNMNCTLYKTENCLPDSRENGFIIPPGGARSLPLPTSPDDPYAFDDQTVAFNCKPL